MNSYSRNCELDTEQNYAREKCRKDIIVIIFPPNAITRKVSDRWLTNNNGLMSKTITLLFSQFFSFSNFNFYNCVLGTYLLYLKIHERNN